MPKKKQQAEEPDSFWVSYSDLATGLMIVFMLVMIIMVILQKSSNEVQTDKLSELVRKLEMILGQKNDLGEKIDRAFKDENGIQADPVTAQLSIGEDHLKFSTGSTALTGQSKAFIADFTPKYLCALYSHESQGCEGKSCKRMDPEAPGAVRRIYVTGHADMVGSYEINHRLSAERAESVVQYMFTILRCLDGQTGLNCRKGIKMPDVCLDKSSELLAYAEERLWSVGAGETLHCTTKLNADKTPRPVSRCSTTFTGDQRFRKVDFGLELTGDDMTGMLADMVSLRKAVGDDREQVRLQELTEKVAGACWNDPHSYHGCHTFILDCLDAGPEDEDCTSMYAKTDNEALRLKFDEVCEDVFKKGGNLTGCEWLGLTSY
jgi:hypothetical protein